jgi:hypothetical protein
MSTKNELKNELKKAVKNAVSSLFEKNEDFYFLVLVTDEEAHSPILSAWSKEKYQEIDDKDIKWSYADSPYFNYGDIFFREVDILFSQRPQMDLLMSEKEWVDEFNFRLYLMEIAMKELDEEDFFERKSKRKDLIINVEVMPPSFANTERALRLNSKETLKEWLIEAAEME